MKKILSICLALCMLLSFVPAAAFAEEPAEAPQDDAPADERVWTVDEIAKPQETPEPAQIDSIIDEILAASKEPNE